jgi:arylformamidase
VSLIDISPLVSPRIAVWPGDTGYSRTVNLAMADGANLDLSHIQTTVHVGAHADAPSHYSCPAPGIAERSLEPYYGPCRVVGAAVGRGERLGVEHLPAGDLPPRLLFRTGTFPDPEDWNTDFAALSPELVDAAAARGVRLLGIDTPSIDLFDDTVLLSHNAVARHDLCVLEGIVLGHVEPGHYLLIALPLKLEGADAAPVRAALSPLP